MSEKKKESLNVDLLYTPHKKQKELHELCKIDGVYFIVVKAGRQSGKTFSAMVQGSIWAIQNPGSVVWYVLPSETQANKIYKEMIGILQASGLVSRSTSSKGNIEIELTNKSVISYKSSAMEKNLRGFSVDYLIIDEGSYIEKEVFESDIMGCLTVRGKKVLIISTPRGKNWFFEYYNKGNDIISNPEFRNLSFNYLDNPLANIALIETAKKTIPEKIFQQEFLGEWVDGAQVFNNINDRMIAPTLYGPQPGETYFLGVDIALSQSGDYTVITVINNKGQVVYIDRFRGLNTPQVKAKIISVMERFNAYKVLIEKNNIGLSIFQELELLYRYKIEGFLTSNTTKVEIISNLIAAFENDLIEIPDNEDLYKELNAYGFEFSSSGRVIYNAIYGNDDMVMSLAIAWHCMQRFSSKRKIIIMV